ncbi:hypothetical protein PR048_002546 [Dryococelus australis]|uniref:Uncharacterized protein n=1 Tax=Dryococelus australis TaxID=614101 RepID=A0ABQ9IKF8_9NEOP|nr:hypothetical protein PR048_002546 [Dryococelus australis]
MQYSLDCIQIGRNGISTTDFVPRNKSNSKHHKNVFEGANVAYSSRESKTVVKFENEDGHIHSVSSTSEKSRVLANGEILTRTTSKAASTAVTASSSTEKAHSPSGSDVPKGDATITPNTTALTVSTESTSMASLHSTNETLKQVVPEESSTTDSSTTVSSSSENTLP